MLRRNVFVLDKSMFAAKRRVILPLMAGPTTPAALVKASYTTDPLKISMKMTFGSVGSAMREVVGAEKMLEGERNRKELQSVGDVEFDALAAFVRGASTDQIISASRFHEAYQALTQNDDVFIWLCHVAMSVLNPGDVRSRLMYRHLETLVKAVAAGEMSRRTAFRFYETAIRSPAYRQLAARQLETGAATRMAGISAAADVMSKSGVCRRPMTAYFELFQRITERSEANTPWGFPALLQFEERMQLPKRIRFFERDNMTVVKKRSKKWALAGRAKLLGLRKFWVPPTWNAGATRFMYPGFTTNPGMPLE